MSASPRLHRRLAAGLAVALAGGAGVLGATVATTATAETGPAGGPGLTKVVFVGNNWDGTATVFDPKTFKQLLRINIVPDLEQRLQAIRRDPVKFGYYLGIRQLVGEGNDQYVDDMFTSHDGRFVFVSRPSLADVIGMDLRTKKIVWRVPMEGYRADHMAISPDGKRLLVSDSTANKVHVIDTAAGKKVGEFASGDSPHENNYSEDGKRIFHASIGLVYTPADRPILDSTKGERYFQIVDAKTNQIRKRLEIGPIMAANGYPRMSSAVRPMAVAPDEKIIYFQLSFLHGFVEFDLEQEKPLRVARLPLSEEAKRTPREQYLLDSAHHGLAINPDGDTLCVAGTMSDYAALVDRKSFEYTLFEGIGKPYWSTNSADGRYCYVSSSEEDKVVVLDYATRKLVAEVPVGDHPQRVRNGVIRTAYLPGSGNAADPDPDNRADDEPRTGGRSLPATGVGLGILALAGSALVAALVAVRLRSRI